MYSSRTIIGLLELLFKEPPCTERYARWCERTVNKIGEILFCFLLLDLIFFAAWQAAFITVRSSAIRPGTNKTVMEKLTNIVKGTMAHLVHVCNGKVIYQIRSGVHLYQLEIDSTEKEWETTYLTPSFKSITLMRWIRKGLEQNDGTFIKLK